MTERAVFREAIDSLIHGSSPAHCLDGVNPAVRPESLPPFVSRYQR
jgi:hypothetical protein